MGGVCDELRQWLFTPDDQNETNNHAEATNGRLNVEMGVQHPN